MEEVNLQNGDEEENATKIGQLMTLREGVAKKWTFPSGPPEPRRTWLSFGEEMVETLCALLSADARLTDSVSDMRSTLIRTLSNDCGQQTVSISRGMASWKCNALALRVSGVECDKCGVSSELDVS